MLAPDDRSTLLELLEPPDGFDLDAAVGLTYTLDLDALLTLPTAFAISGALSSDEVEDGPLTPLGLLDALRTYADRITVCCDASRISLPAKARSGVFAFLEDSVLPVRAPRGGAFHPKLWAIRFSDGDGAFVHRLIISSRNLTFDRSWDTVISLNESEHTKTGLALPQVEVLLRACVGDELSIGTVRPEHRGRVQSISSTIGAARFDAPPGFDEMSLHVLGVSQHHRSRWPFPSAASRLLVVSPFLKRTMLDRLPCSWGNVTIVSRPDEIDNALGDLATADTEDERRREPVPVVRTINPSVVDVDTEAKDTLAGLHAKLFVADVAGGKSHVYSGSANATAAAFDRNVEVMLELVGRTKEVGTEQILGSDGIGPLLVPHSWGDALEPPDTDDSAVAKVRVALCGLQLSADVSVRSDGRYDVRYRQVGSLPDLGDVSDVQLSLRPITLAGWTDTSGIGSIDHTFALSESAISAFLGVKVTCRGESEEFLLVGTLFGAPEGRMDRIVAGLLASPERLVRYLMMLLLDPTQDRFDASIRGVLERSHQTTVASLPTVPLMEVMAKALVNNRARLAEVEGLFTALSEQSDLVDAGLAQLWQSIWQAAQLEDAR